MEISQWHINDYFAKWTGKITDDKIIVNYRNLIKDTTYEHKYEDMDPHPQKQRYGHTGWSGIGWFFAFCGFILLVARDIFPQKGLNPVYLGTILVCFILWLAFLCIKFIKRDILLFKNKNGEILFYLDMPKDKAFSDLLIEKIKMASNKNAAA
jgi:hypothetical protein